MSVKNDFFSVILAMLFIVGIFIVGYLPQQSDFPLIFVGFSIAFASYTLLIFKKSKAIGIAKLIGLGVLARIMVMFALPNLSDDIYRFLWDGSLINLGINPYSHLPSEVMLNQGQDYMQLLFENMNSQNYFTIYPPISQLIFYIAAFFGNLTIGAIVIKIVFLIAEVYTLWGILKLLDFLNKDRNLAFIYFLNPLLIIEGMVNLHFEIMMISFLVWSIYFLYVKKRLLTAGVMMACSIGVKLLPIMFLPYFLFKLAPRERIKFFAATIISSIIIFQPIFWGLDVGNFGSSIDLYFRKFEFNASIYYLLRYIGKLISGYNLIAYIGPLLGIISFFIIMKLASKKEKINLQGFLNFAFLSFVCYLLTTTTVHPWYMSIPILLSVFVKYRFAILWSFLIVLSYINYSYDPYFENLWIVGFEYFCVLIFLIISNRGKK